MITLASIFLTWVISGVLFGLLGAFYGPGAAVLIAGLLIGICGGFVHVGSRIFKLELRWWYAGVCIASVEFVITMLIVGGGAQVLHLTGIFVFYAVLNTIIFSYADLIGDNQNDETNIVD